MSCSKVLVGSLVLYALGCADDDVRIEDGTGSAAGALERGKYLVDNVVGCGDCHTPRDDTGARIAAEYLAGSQCFAQLPNGSCLNSRNLTSHETGLANRTDDEIRAMIRDGVRPSATGDVALSPIMPYYVLHNMTEDDLSAIVAYLRSVPGVEHEVPRSGPEFEWSAPANPLDPAIIPLPMAGYAETERAMRGRYLAGEVGACLECHTRHVEGNPNVVDYAGFFQGGERFEIGLPVTPVSKNLTSDAETGLGDWTVEDIVRALKEGSEKDGDGVCPPMPAGPMSAYGGLTDDDALDIAHYVKSLPPAVNAINDMCSWPPM